MPFKPTRENLALMHGLLVSQNSIQDIAAYIECSERTVLRWKKRLRENPGEFFDRRENNGPAKVLSLEEVQYIRLLAELNPFMPATKIMEELMLDCCVTTVKKAMHEELDIHCFKPAIKNKLINIHKEQRLQFAQDHLNFTPEQWRNSVFVDEKVFSTHKDGRTIVWRPPNLRYDERYILPRSWSGRATKCFWGWICGYFPGELVPVPRRLDAIGYRDLLNDVLLPSITAVFGDENGVLREPINIIEDNSAIHTAHIVRDWYADHPELRRLHLPPRSPDLNIIENVWSKMVRDWTPSMARTEDELIHRVNEAWDSLRGEGNYLNILTDSMTRRCQNVLNVGGAVINY